MCVLVIIDSIVRVCSCMYVGSAAPHRTHTRNARNVRNVRSPTRMDIATHPLIHCQPPQPPPMQQQLLPLRVSTFRVGTYYIYRERQIGRVSTHWGAWARGSAAPAQVGKGGRRRRPFFLLMLLLGMCARLPVCVLDNGRWLMIWLIEHKEGEEIVL